MPHEIKVLGRVVTYNDWGWSLEADPALLESAIDKLNLSCAKGVSSPGVRLDEGCSGAEVRTRRLMATPIPDPDAAWPGSDNTAPLGPKD